MTATSIRAIRRKTPARHGGIFQFHQQFVERAPGSSERRHEGRRCSCLVTGANRGLGAAIAQAFLDAGAKVYGAARDHDNHEPARHAVRLDMTNDDDIANAARTLRLTSPSSSTTPASSASSTSLAPAASRLRERRWRRTTSVRCAWRRPSRRSFARTAAAPWSTCCPCCRSSRCHRRRPTSASKAAAWSLTNGAPHRAPPAGDPRRRGARRLHRHRHGCRCRWGEGQPGVRCEADRRGIEATPRRSSPMRPARW